jgi:hypothetical protein
MSWINLTLTGSRLLCSGSHHGSSSHCLNRAYPGPWAATDLRSNPRALCREDKGVCSVLAASQRGKRARRGSRQEGMSSCMPNELLDDIAEGLFGNRGTVEFSVAAHKVWQI